MSNSNPKLTLKKSTLRNLSVEEIMHIEGGSSGHHGELTYPVRNQVPIGLTQGPMGNSLIQTLQ